MMFDHFVPLSVEQFRQLTVKPSLVTIPNSDVYMWLEENVGRVNHDWMLLTESRRMVFRAEDHGVMFKMRWL